MRAEKLADQIGKTLTVCEGMKVVHATRLTGDPLAVQYVDLLYLRPAVGDAVVQTKAFRGKVREWDFNAICNANFDKLPGFKEYAQDLIENDQPGATLRQAIMRNAEQLFNVSAMRPSISASSVQNALVEHSEERDLRH